jgi:hypothetical protein
MPDTNELLVRMNIEDGDGNNIPVYPETKPEQLQGLSAFLQLLMASATTASARKAIAAVADSELTTGDVGTFAESVIKAIGEETLTALGVRYSITTNGYICFGELFGGLILQWGYRNTNDSGWTSDKTIGVLFPIKFTGSSTYFLQSIGAMRGYATSNSGSSSLGITVYGWLLESSGPTPHTCTFVYFALGY